MGKGDKKSRRGKIVIGSSGVRRPRKAKKNAIPAKKIITAEAKVEIPVVVAETPAVVKKTTVRKAAQKASVESGKPEKPKTTKTRKKAEETASDIIPESRNPEQE